MAKNKIVFDGVILINLETDTVTESDVMEGVVFHLPSGEVSEGTFHDITDDVRYILDEEEF